MKSHWTRHDPLGSGPSGAFAPGPRGAEPAAGTGRGAGGSTAGEERDPGREGQGSCAWDMASDMFRSDMFDKS